MTYNNIIELFERFADNHFFVKKFYQGEIPEITNDKKTEYPLLYPLYTGSTYDIHVENMNFEVYILDLPLTKEDRVDQQRNIVSDCKQVAEDIIADINNGGNIFVFTDQVDVVDSSITPAIDTQTNLMSGVILNLTIALPYTASACNAPLTGVTPTSTDCQPATYQNSDGSFSQEISSGNTFTSSDITVTDVNGSTRAVPSNKNITCAFSSIVVKDSGGNTLTTIASYPDGGEVTLTGSGIVYESRFPTFTESFVTGDSWDHYTSGDYDRTIPTLPASYATIKRTATQSDVRATPATGTSASDAVVPTILESNNAFGNKFRFTDDQGNASNATVGSNLYAHVDWRNHDWTTAGSTEYYVIDHLTGFGYTVKYAEDGAKFNMNSTSDGQDWADWIAFINGTHHGYTGWMPLDCSDVLGAHGACSSPEMIYADSFFEFQALGGNTRGTFFLGESAHSTVFQVIYDTGNYDDLRGSTKATSGGFVHRTTNIFMKRKHY